MTQLHRCSDQCASTACWELSTSEAFIVEDFIYSHDDIDDLSSVDENSMFWHAYLSVRHLPCLFLYLFGIFLYLACLHLPLMNFNW